LLLAIPILDTTVAVLSRVRRHLSAFQGGQDHLSHRLIRAGLSRKQTAFSLWSLSAFFAGVAILISTTRTSVEIYLVTGVGLLWVIMFILFFRTRDS
jgi:UDP-GlcNAc:undecaprenyl-phosphate GlcNAc-1-phosphate transferase